MASMAMAMISSKLIQLRNPKEVTFRSLCNHAHTSGSTTSINIQYAKQDIFTRLLLSHGEGFRRLSQPRYAVRSGSEASTTDLKDIGVTLTNTKIVVESRDGDKIQLRVDLTGKQTQKVFDEVLTNLASTAPAIPGFRRTKGGKTSNVPKNFLLRAIGESRVTKFVIHEIVSTTMTEYAKEENLNVKKEFNTIQTAAELETVFAPGKEFGFNGVLEIEKSETETESSSSSQV